MSWRLFFNRRRAEEELETELEHHFELQVRDNEAAGMDPIEARRRAAIEFGRLDLNKEECRDSTGYRWIDDVVKDVRHGVRTLVGNPAFTFTVVATLALGIGANTAIFSVAYAVFLKPLPYAAEDRLMTLAEVDTETGRIRAELSPPDFLDIRSDTSTFDAVVAAEPYSETVLVDGDLLYLRTWMVTRGFFEVLGVPAELGRTFSQEEYDGNTRVAILAHDFWQTRFGGDPDVLGRDIGTPGDSIRVVGVMPSNFSLPQGAEWQDRDLWTPHPEPESLAARRGSSYFPAIARLGEGFSLIEAQGELDSLGDALAADFPDSNLNRRFRALPLREHLSGNLQPAVLSFVAAAGLVLLLASLNVANLLLIRGAGRCREWNVRHALGAGRGRIARQMLAENGTLVLGGTAIGIAVAYGSLPTILALSQGTSPLLSTVSLDPTVLAGSVLAGGLAVLLIGLGPSFRSSWRLASGLATRGSASTTATQTRMRGILAGTQIALALTLLAGAGLLTRSVWNLMQVDPGFRPGGVVTAQLNFFGGPAAGSPTVATVVDHLNAIPGVSATGAVSNLPFDAEPYMVASEFSIEGRGTIPNSRTPRSLHTAVTPGYFAALGIPLERGRMPTAFDTAGRPTVAVVNEAMVREHWQGEDPIGDAVNLGYPFNTVAEVIGVIGDVKLQRLDAAALPEFYVPVAQSAPGILTFVIRADGDLADLAPQIRRAIADAVPGVPLQSFATLDSLMTESIRGERLGLFLLGTFALVGILLAGVGLYGVLAYSVTLRKSEIGLRMTLGASRTGILGMVFRHALWLWAAGSLAGTLAAIALTRFLSSMLYGVEPNDPLTLASVLVLTALISMAAAAIPAYRASRLAPLTALRSD